VRMSGRTTIVRITFARTGTKALAGVDNNVFGQICGAGPRQTGIHHGGEVRAVVQAMPAETPGDELADELMEFCREQLATMKCPRSTDFIG
jgi:hypothetical protein